MERDGFIFYQHSTQGGNSGGPILVRNNITNEYEIVGIHKGLSPNPKYNWGVMSKQIEAFYPNIKQAIKSHSFENELK